VRNSGAHVVVEGCGSNGCEYMTGGIAAILGPVGHNFGAGMTGGMAFVHDADESFMEKVNATTLRIQRVQSEHWEGVLRGLVEAHARETASPLARALLREWEAALPRFWQICPTEMVNRLDHPLSDAPEAATA
jgi:glutamate synthase (NADPH/NADH) large chain